MTDRSELQALQAALRGTLAAAALLEAHRERIDALDASSDLSISDLEELARESLANAVASQALRSLVEGMRARRTSEV
jgi:hypothetical protein